MKFFCYPIWYTQWPKEYKVSLFSQKCNMQRGTFVEWNYNACMFHIWSLYSIIETLNMNISNLDVTFQCLSLSFSQAQSLTTIDLSHNHLTGQIISSHQNEIQGLVDLNLCQFNRREYSNVPFLPSITANLVSLQQPIFQSNSRNFPTFLLSYSTPLILVATIWKGQYPSLNSEIFRPCHFLQTILMAPFSLILFSN